MTYRERRLARADRLDEWAEKREARSDAAYEGVRRIADGIPFGQPILVGHHSERAARRDQDRIERGMRAAVDHQRTAERMSSTAETIRAQADRAIYSDDDDAIEQLEARIAGLEAERARIKAYNALRRKRKSDTEGIAEDAAAAELTDAETRNLVDTIRVQPYACKLGTFPGYHLQNLGGNITRNRKRLEQVRRDQVRAASDDPRGRGRQMYARFSSPCADCGATIEKGAPITYYRATREAVCGCVDGNQSSSDDDVTAVEVDGVVVAFSRRVEIA